MTERQDAMRGWTEFECYDIRPIPKPAHGHWKPWQPQIKRYYAYREAMRCELQAWDGSRVYAGGPLAVEIEIALTGKRRRVDASNLAEGVLDALQRDEARSYSGLFDDDAMIDHLLVRRWFEASRYMIRIRVKPLIRRARGV